MAQLQHPGADCIFLIDAAAQLKSNCWPCGSTFQLACVLSAWTLISIRFISPLLPCFFITALALCSLDQSYIHWSSCSGILTLPGDSCSPMMQLSLNLSPESDPGVSQKPVRIKSLWTRRDWLDSLMLPVSPPSPGREASFPVPLGPTPDSQGSIRWPEGPPGQALQKQEISVQPRESLVAYLMAFHSKQHATNRHSNRTKGFWQLVEFIVAEMWAQWDRFAADISLQHSPTHKKEIRFNSSWSLSPI